MAAEVPRLGEVLFETTRIGSAVRVAAIDPASGQEAVVVGPAAAGRHLRELAVRKLAFLLERRDDSR